MTMTVPVIPDLPAGHIATVADLNALSAAATFLLTKPIAKVTDTTGGVALSTGGTVITYTTATIDTDGMWSAGSPNRLTVQTPGWYHLRYMVCVKTSPINNSVARSTSGPNNPLGAGSNSSFFWAGYAGPAPGQLCGHGLWPFYLFAGDFIQLLGIEASGNTTTTDIHDVAGNTGAGSFLSLEYVSAT